MTVLPVGGGEGSCGIEQKRKKFMDTNNSMVIAKGGGRLWGGFAHRAPPAATEENKPTKI